MVFAALSKNNRISLEPISYKNELKIRLLLNRLSPFEREALREILHSSLRISLTDLAESLLVEKAELFPLLKILVDIGLLTHQQDMLFIEKEKRKLFEVQLERFEEDFEPGIAYLQQILQRVPLERVFDWYQLGRTASNIFQSILERIFHTPKQYERYLMELNFQDSRLQAILEQLLNAPEFQLSVQALRKKYKLSEEEFEEIALLMELHMAAFVKNSSQGPILQILEEWRQHHINQKANLPKPLKASQVKPDPAHKTNLELYRQLLIAHIKQGSVESVERSVREIEKELQLLSGKGWFLCEDFIKGFKGHVGKAEEVQLTRTGTKWHYRLPSYSQIELSFIESVVFELFTTTGITSTGLYQGKRCFSVQR
jgi:hypothetical protein